MQNFVFNGCESYSFYEIPKQNSIKNIRVFTSYVTISISVPMQIAQEIRIQSFTIPQHLYLEASSTRRNKI